MSLEPMLESLEERLKAENAELRIRLGEAEQAINAIRLGAVDALVTGGPGEQQVYTLIGAETPYRSFVEHMQEGAVAMTMDGTILYCNRRFAEIVGWPLERVVGRTFQSLGTSESAVSALLAQAEWGASRGELRLSKLGSAGVPVFAAVQRLTGEGADLCMVVTELTEIVAARLLVGELEIRVDERTAALVATNLELQGFTYSVSHDMRTPLRAIVGNANMVFEDEGSNLSENGRRQLQSLATAAVKMAQLVDDLLQFARLGGSALVIERINLSQLIEKVSRDVQPLHSECELELTVAPDLWVDGDARFLGMALQNLLDNACKYRKAGMPARVEVGKEECGGKPVFFIRDEGIGFDMQYVPKLFVPFERLHRDSDYPGTGIGLANVKRAIERHGGIIWAEGELGVGSKFSFTLPDANLGVHAG
ncbi:sensor histidine kinase [Fimbriimonas ginsengisoli]|nr:ATP-binding protein [Fimbriimonas ginsengisoli]